MNKLGGLISAAALVFTVACAQTDSGITTSVKSKFAADDMVKAYQIDVDTQDHVVTLRGEVESETARARALQLATATDGVTNVIDQMVVRDAAATSGRGDVDVDVDPELKNSAERGGEIVKEGAKETGEAVKDGAVKVKEGAEKVGGSIKDAVTDKDRDSDKDGK